MLTVDDTDAYGDTDACRRLENKPTKKEKAKMTEIVFFITVFECPHTCCKSNKENSNLFDNKLGIIQNYIIGLMFDSSVIPV